MGCIMLEGILSNKSALVTDFGPKPVNMILFQAPVRNGVSGSPIFDSKGRVVGIEDTKVFGISPALDELRNKWQESAHIAFSGIDLGGSFTELINNLDQNLISGLGSGVDIEYARLVQESEHK
jgi:S1-C subfamily serine protease